MQTDKKIGIQLALLIALFGFTLAISQSGITAYYEFKDRQEYIEHSTREIIDAITPSAAHAVYEYDDKAAETIIQGLSLFDYIIEGSIADNFGHSLARFTKPPHRQPSTHWVSPLLNIRPITYTIPLTNPATHKEAFGTLRVIINPLILLEPVIKRTINSFLVHVLNSTLLICVIWLIVHFFVTTPLATLERSVKKIGEGDWDAPIGVIRQDEIGSLAKSVNTMLGQLKQSFLDISSSEKKFRAFFNATSDAIFVHDSQSGKILDVNQTMLDMYGYTYDDLGSFNLNLLSANDSDFNEQAAQEWIEKTLAEGPKYVEWHARHRNGDLFWVEVALKRAEIEGADRVLAVVRDITQRKIAEQEKENLEKQLHQIQKIEAIGKLAGGVAHDFNNMLSVVIGYTEILQMEFKPDDDKYKTLNTILETAAHRSTQLVSQLLAFARKQTIQPIVFNINETIESLLEMLGQLIGENISLKWSPDETIGSVKMDPGQVDQILANLVVNARDAIGGTGVISIATSSLVLDDTYCDTHADATPGTYIVLTVEDTGCGIDKQHQKEIFEPFFTTKEVGMGTGLGLSTVYGIIRQNSGFINVYSELGQGSSFKIFLPASTPEDAQGATLPTPRSPIRGSGTILVVEDDTAILAYCKSALERLGYTVMTAATPDLALASLSEHSGAIDLLITDVVMPHMNGRELSERMTQILPSLKTLFMSGYTADVIAHHGILDKDVHYIQKPFTINQLSSAVFHTITLPCEDGPVV